MQIKRSHIIWMANDGAGKTRTFQINPALLRILGSVLFVCVCSVPLLELSLFSLQERIKALEIDKQGLQNENLSLRVVRTALARVEENDKKLRRYFGMEAVQSLEKIVGRGGHPNIDRSGVLAGRDEPEEFPLPQKLQALVSNREIIQGLTIRQRRAWDSTPSIVPVALKDPKISSRFGWRMNPMTQKEEFHAGIDVIGEAGTKVISPSDATVIKIGYDPRLGNFLVLEHTQEIKTIYGHLDKIVVKEKAQVKRGDSLGIMGNTGMSTGHHLHYTVVVNHRAVNPFQFILDRVG